MTRLRIAPKISLCCAWNEPQRSAQTLVMAKEVTGTDKASLLEEDLVFLSGEGLKALHRQNERICRGCGPIGAEHQDVHHRWRKLAELVADSTHELRGVDRPNRRPCFAKPANLDVEADVGTEGHAKVGSAYGHPVGLVLESETALLDQAQRDAELEQEIAPAFIVPLTAGLLSDLVAVGLRERAKTRRPREPSSDLGRERGLTRPEEICDECLASDGRSLQLAGPGRAGFQVHVPLCFAP